MFFLRRRPQQLYISDGIFAPQAQQIMGGIMQILLGGNIGGTILLTFFEFIYYAIPIGGNLSYFINFFGK